MEYNCNHNEQFVNVHFYRYRLPLSPVLLYRTYYVYKLQLTNIEINPVNQETEYHWIRGAHFIDHDALKGRLEVINIIAF